jgi:mRNA interferase RelE/StbE
MWTIDFLPEAARDLNKLDPQHTNRILKFLNDRVAELPDPRAIGAALKGSRFGGYWKYIALVITGSSARSKMIGY